MQSPQAAGNGVMRVHIVVVFAEATTQGMLETRTLDADFVHPVKYGGRIDEVRLDGHMITFAHRVCHIRGGGGSGDVVAAVM